MKKQIPSVVFLLCPLTFLAACSSDTLDGGSNADRPQLSCDNRSIESTCATFPTGTTEADAKSHCDGSVIEGPCPSTQVVGTCTVGNPQATNTYYGDGPKPWTEASAREVCEKTFSGTFRAP